MECVGVSEASGGGKSEGERATGGGRVDGVRGVSDVSGGGEIEGEWITGSGASRWSAWGKRGEWGWEE